jgi:putative transposase
MDERLRFVARRLDGEKMAVLCREFEISRKTGYPGAPFINGLDAAT